MLRWYSSVILQAMVVLAPGVALASDIVQFPRFRHVDKAAPPRQATLPANLTLLVDDDFAPYSFQTADGKFSGLSLQMALGACAELRVQCQVKALPHEALAAALEQKQGDIIIAAAQPKAAAQWASTRPYFLSYSGFFVRSGTSFSGVDVKSLAGRRIGFVAASAQEAFLKANFDRSSLVPFADEAALFDALRTGGLDLAFADRVHGAFWIKGSDSRGCCLALDQGFSDPTTFTKGLVMLTRPQDEGLRDALDDALDRLQEKGQAAKIFASFLPASPF
jgi:polar amino acid transport system substrate-binding protein